MSLGFRNLVLFTLVCALVSSMSISQNVHRNQNHHMIKIHESASKSASHQQAASDPANWAQNAQKIVDSISSSVKPDVPSIIDTKNIPTLAFDRSSCDNLKIDQRKQIQAKVKSTRDSVTSFKSKVTDNKKISADADNSIQYLNVIQKLTNVNCGEVTTYLLIGPVPYQTNINTKKAWILGGITMDDLVKDYINRITVNNNATNCGTDTPFWNGFKCIDCKDPKPIFNIATSECVACPEGKVFDAITRTCIDGKPSAKSFKPNPTAEPNVLVPDGAPKDALKTYMGTGNESCPTDKPFVKDNTCIPCPTDKPYFNIIDKQCQQCPVGFVFDVATHKCIPGKPIATDVPLNNPRLVMNDNSTNADWDAYVKENENKPLCGTDKPFWTGNECIQCPDLFNVITKKCIQCEPGLSIHTDTHKCEPANRLEPSLKDLFNAIF